MTEFSGTQGMGLRAVRNGFCWAVLGHERPVGQGKTSHSMHQTVGAKPPQRGATFWGCSSYPRCKSHIYKTFLALQHLNRLGPTPIAKLRLESGLVLALVPLPRRETRQETRQDQAPKTRRASRSNGLIGPRRAGHAAGPFNEPARFAESSANSAAPTN